MGQDTCCAQFRHTRLTASKPWPATGLARLKQKEVMAKHLCCALPHILMVLAPAASFLSLQYICSVGELLCCTNL
jgi:hypothetical protein